MIEDNFLKFLKESLAIACVTAEQQGKVSIDFLSRFEAKSFINALTNKESVMTKNFIRLSELTETAELKLEGTALPVFRDEKGKLIEGQEDVKRFSVVWVTKSGNQAHDIFNLLHWIQD